MSLAFGAAGAAAAGTTSLAVPYPTGSALGSFFLMGIESKYPADPPTTPSGWTLEGTATGGSGASGADSGDVLVSVYTKPSDGTETGNQAVTITNGNSAVGRMVRITGQGAGFGVAVTSGADTSSGTGWSIVGAADPGITIDDLVYVVLGSNSDVSFSGSSLSASGITFSSSTERADNLTTQGDDSALLITEFDVTAGTATGAPTFTTTASGASAGAAVIVRIRETGVRFAGSGGGNTGTTSVAATFPSPLAAGDLLVYPVVNKYDTTPPTTPSGWTKSVEVTGGSGAPGVDSGTMNVVIYTKEADGTETGSQMVTITGGNSARGRIWRFRKDTGMVWSLAATSGADTSVGTDWSVTGGSDPGITAGDQVVTASGINTDVASFSNQAITSTGVTYNATGELEDTATGTGDDIALVVTRTRALSGTSSAAPVYTMTASAAGANGPAGATAILRIRQTALNQNWDVADVGSATAEGVDPTFTPGATEWAVAVGSASAEGIDPTFAAIATWPVTDVGTATAVGVDPAFTPGATEWAVPDVGVATAEGIDPTFAVGWSVDVGEATATGVDPAWAVGWLVDVGTATAVGIDPTFVVPPVDWPVADVGTATAVGIDPVWVRPIGRLSSRVAFVNILSSTVAIVGDLDGEVESR